MNPTVPKSTYLDVYYVETTNEEMPVNPIAIRPSIDGKKILWEDTSRGTSRTFTHIKKISSQSGSEGTNAAPDKIVFSTPKGETITLTKMTLKLYNEFLKTRVAECPDFDSDEAVKKHYLRTNFELY